MCIRDRSHILHIFDAAGESRAVKDITELLGGEGVEACAADAAGYIYLLTSGGGALVLDRGGGFVSRSAGEGGFSGLVRLGEKVCALLNTCLLYTSKPLRPGLAYPLQEPHKAAALCGAGL